MKEFWDWLIWEIYKLQVELNGWIGTWFIGWHPVAIILFGVGIITLIMFCIIGAIFTWRAL